MQYNMMNSDIEYLIFRDMKGSLWCKFIKLHWYIWRFSCHYAMILKVALRYGIVVAGGDEFTVRK